MSGWRPDGVRIGLDNGHSAIDDIEREATMSEAQALIPPPAVVREKLSNAVRETQFLRSLLRLSIRASEERDRAEHSGRPSAPRLEGAAR